MTQSAPTYHPACQLLLRKNVGRTASAGGVPVSERFRGIRRTIDLAPWLDDQSGVKVTKSTRQPAGGFSITLADKPDQSSLDTIYGLIEPMDVIEIRMAREPHRYSGKLPIIMRGFISTVTRKEAIGANGAPQRTVVIVGQDYGKLWQIFQIFYERNFTIASYLLSEYKFFAQFGEGFQTQSCTAFIRTTINAVLNRFIAQMQAKDNAEARLDAPGDPFSPVVRIQASASDMTASPGTVAPFGINQFSGGTVYQLLSTFGDVGAWNELFLEDREDGVHCVFRANPFYSASGQFLPSAAPPGRFTVTKAEIQSLSVERSDTGVANYYWVDAPRSQMNNGSTLRQYAVQGQPETFLVTNRNSSAEIYGLRKMTVNSNQGDPSERYNGNGLPEAVLNDQFELTSAWITQRRVELANQNRDNVVFESGTIAIRGSEKAKAGRYVDVQRGNFSWSAYVHQVDHDFLPYRGFFTTLHVDRGTGFIERTKRERGSAAPYYAEMSDV